MWGEKKTPKSLGKASLCNSHRQAHTLAFTLHISYFSPKVIKIRAKSWLFKKAEITNIVISFKEEGP